MTTQDYNLITRLKGIAINRCKITEDAEDVMQDVFLRILLRADFETMTENEKERFAVSLVKNRCTDYYRMRKHRGYAVDPYEANLKVKPDVFAKMELKEVMKKSVNRKSLQTLLLFEQGYRTKELAKMKGIEPVIITQRICYARKYLRRA